jgi:hypothetical protein
MTISDSDYQAMLAQARATDEQRSLMERQAGFAAPSMLDAFDLLRTAEMALECAVKTQDWAVVCEGIVFVQQAIDACKRGTRYDH